MSMYAAKNNDGEWLAWEVYQDHPEFIRGGGSAWTDLDQAEFYAKLNGGHVIELTEAPAKVVVSEEEAEMLKKAKRNKYPATLISNHTNDEDRLMRAYVNGWTVEKPKRWNVKVPHSRFYYWKWKDDEIGIGSGEDDDVLGVEPYRFTNAEIEHYGLGDCERIEVKDND